MSLNLALDFLQDIIKKCSLALEEKNHRDFMQGIYRFMRLLKKEDNSVTPLKIDLKEYRVLNRSIHRLKLENLKENTRLQYIFSDSQILIAKDILNMLEAIYRNSKETPKAPRRGTKENIKISMHSATQLIGGKNIKKELTIDKQYEYRKDTLGLQNLTNPDRYGISLTPVQMKVFTGIIRAFSETDYKGDYELSTNKYIEEVLEPEDFQRAKTILKDIDSSPYKNIESIPVLKVTQAQLIELSGYDLKKQRQGDKDEVVESLNFFSNKLFCFYYERAVKEKGKIVIDKRTGKYKMEIVEELSTIFRIKKIYDKENNTLKEYEISPAGVLIDQVNEHFLLVPANWMNEVKQLTGKRTPSKYTYEFLFWLRFEYENIRRNNSKKGNKKKRPYVITKTHSQICETIKIPQSIYKKTKTRSERILNDCYSIAIQLNYLEKVEEKENEYILYLNENHYPQPGKLEMQIN
jgi:hypothetical protein